MQQRTLIEVLYSITGELVRYTPKSLQKTCSCRVFVFVISSVHDKPKVFNMSLWLEFAGRPALLRL